MREQYVPSPWTRKDACQRSRNAISLGRGRFFLLTSFSIEGVHPPPPLARRHGMAMESVSSCR